MFKCKVCLEKDNRLLDLKEQNKQLMYMVQKLTIQPQLASENIEANAILDGIQNQLTVQEANPELEAQRLADIQEAHAMLTGSY